MRGVWRPHREMRARTRSGSSWMRPQLLVCAVMRAFAEEINVLFREHA
jgi:hypothetical protein